MNILRYILSSSACLLIAYCVYRLVFRHDNMFRHQRLFLVATLILSLLLPATRFRIELQKQEVNTFTLRADQNAGYELTEITRAENPVKTINYAALLLYMYLTVMSLLLLNTVYQVLRIAFVIRSSRKEQYNDLVICSGDKISSPYSFLWWIFIPDSVTDPEERHCIIAHESVHASQLHSVDIIMVEVLAAVLWFNPAIWLFRRSLLLLHEYLADEGTLNSGVERLKYQALLINQATEEKLVFVKSSFNNKLLKKRIIMMTEMKNRRNGKFRILNLISVSTIMFITVALLNSFFPKDVKAASQKATSATTATSTQEVKKEKKRDKKDDKKDLEEVTVTGYQKSVSAESTGQDVKKDNTETGKDLKEVTVIGYGKSEATQDKKGRQETTTITVKSNSTANNIVISENKSSLDEVTVIGYSNGRNSQIPDSVNYIVDGVSVKNISDLNPDSIGSVNVLKQDKLIIIRTKSYEKKVNKINKPAGTIIISDKSSLPGNLIYILDDKQVSKEDIQNVNPNNIESISVLKDKEKVKQYSNEEHDGVIIITTKSKK
jgi:beta-lactamase regulating signal transducer with metallopeptidase domain